MSQQLNSLVNNSRESAGLQFPQESDLGSSIVKNLDEFLNNTPTENSPGPSRTVQPHEMHTSSPQYNAEGLLNSLLRLEPGSLCTDQCRSFTISIVNEWLDIRNHVIKLELQLERAMAQLPKRNCSYNQNLSGDESSIRLPMNNMEQFNEYCNLLTTSDDCRRTFDEVLRHTVCPGKKLKKNIAAVLKRFITIQLASEFTTQRTINDKKLLRKTIFYQHLSDFFLNSEVTGEPEGCISPATFLKTVSQVMMNCRDWERNKQRRKKKNETTD